MGKNGWYIILGIVGVVVLVSLMSKTSTTTGNTTVVSGGAGWLVGAGSLIGSLSKGISNIWGGSSSDGYTPSVTYGSDSTIGEVN